LEGGGEGVWVVGVVGGLGVWGWLFGGGVEADWLGAEEDQHGMLDLLGFVFGIFEVGAFEPGVDAFEGGSGAAEV